MKEFKKIVALVFALVLMFSLCTAAFADESAEYTVRLYSGNSEVGSLTVGDGTVYSQQLANGAEVTYTADQVVVNDERYYPKGFREAGHDNNPVYTFGTSIAITRDIDFVIAYGMRSTAVTYTVYYQHATTGENLLDPQTFYGNEGDKPVVAFQYIENYLPQAYNLTKTLSDTESENVFTFLYSPITTGQTVVPAADTTTNANENAATNANDNAAADANADAAANANANAAANANANAAGNGAAPGAGQENVTPAEPEDIIDLDVPLAGPEQGENGTGEQGENGTESNRNSTTGYIVGGAVLVCALGGLLFFLKKKKKANVAD